MSTYRRVTSGNNSTLPEQDRQLAESLDVGVGPRVFILIYHYFLLLHLHRDRGQFRFEHSSVKGWTKNTKRLDYLFIKCWTSNSCT